MNNSNNNINNLTMASFFTSALSSLTSLVLEIPAQALTKESYLIWVTMGALSGALVSATDKTCKISCEKNSKIQERKI